MHAVEAEQGAGAEGDIHAGELVIRQGPDLAGLRIGQARGGVEHIRAGADTDLELPALAFEGPGGQDHGLTCGEDALPLLVEQVDGVIHLLEDGQSALVRGGQTLEPDQDRPVDAGLRRLVAEGNLASDPQRPAGEIPIADLVEHVAV